MEATTYSSAYQQGLGRTIKFLISRGVHYDLAPDIAQAAWVRGWERLEQMRDDSAVLAWINTIALNHFRRNLHNQNREGFHPENNQKRSTVLNWAAIDVNRILSACGPNDRRLLEAQLEGTTTKELADEEGVSQTAIRIRLMRARRRARQICQPAVPLRQAA